jgi:hypothetical protein
VFQLIDSYPGLAIRNLKALAKTLTFSPPLGQAFFGTPNLSGD